MVNDEKDLLATDASVATFQAAIAGGNPSGANTVAEALSAAELGNALRGLTRTQATALYEVLGDERLATLVHRLRPEEAGDVLQLLSNVEAADVLDEMAPDDAADVIGAIKKDDPTRVQPILVEMDRVGDVEELLAFLPDTAGGRMTNDFIAVRPETTAANAITTLQTRIRAGEFRNYVYVTDALDQLVGVVPVYRLVLEVPETPVADFMVRNPVSVRGTDDQEHVALVFQDKHFLALPVLDLEGRLIGVITADDIADVIVTEATEDMYKMAGVGIKEHAFSPVFESASRRVPWLAFNMAWAFAGAFIISLFEGTLQKAAVLAVFMPMIAGQAGNAGIQTATIVVRSMALGEVADSRAFALLRKEWALSMIKGAIFGTILGLIAWVWKGEPFLGLIAGAAMFLNMIVAGTTGVVLPLTLRRLGFDPATIAGVFDTMLTDLMGFLIYLGLATLFISRLT